MGNNEDKERHSRRRKRNFIAKVLRDPGDQRGAFALKIVNPKKSDYKRVKLSIKDLEDNEDDEI